MQEVLEYHKDDIKNSKVLENLNLKPKEFFIVSTHREENVDSEQNFNDLLESLNAIAHKYDKRINGTRSVFTDVFYFSLF